MRHWPASNASQILEITQIGQPFKPFYKLVPIRGDY